jgi:subtilisin-like proprotein convertase family protein
MLKRSARTGMLACACIGSLGLLAGVSPASAKSKTVHKTFSSCQNVALTLAANNDNPAPPSPSAVQTVSFTVPKTPKGSKPTGGKVTGASVGVRITHSYDNDVAILLISPAGRFVPLDTGHGDTDDNFGAGSTDCNGTLTTFTDSAPTPISGGAAPFAGAFRPDSPLSALNGSVATGVWTVVLTDTVQGDDGTVHAVSLTLAYDYKKPKKK